MAELRVVIADAETAEVLDELVIDWPADLGALDDIRGTLNDCYRILEARAKEAK